MDVIFKNIKFKDKNGLDINIFEEMKKFANSNPKIKSIYVKNIL